MASYEHVLTRLLAHLRPHVQAGIELDESAELVGTLGLDSTVLVHLLADVEDEFDISVPLNHLADIRTVGDLARMVQRLSEDS